MGGVDEEETVKGPGVRGMERILVSVRVRPLNEKEVLRKEAVDWECINDTTIMYKNHLSPERSMYPSSYSYDRVFRCDCSTKQVYEEGAKSVVLSAVSGINSSVFAYGQTSSGKTFTMSGVTEYTMEDIFDYIQKHKEREFQLKFSAMEIYNESVRDLLTSDNSSLRLLDDPERGTVVEKLTEETLRDWDHFKELLAVCEAQRQIGETFLNEASSRSHQILRLTIESSTREFLGKNHSSSLAATLNFVDLAGSERASQALSAGSRLKEGSHINRSLLTLGTVIRKLSKGGPGHIPYRDSKLTRILQSSLGGNARTAIICTMSPARSYVEQSRNTLLFASCAKEVATNAHVNVVISDKALVKHLQKELSRLENELRSANPSIRDDATNLLREKDSKIEELETRVRNLTLQLDLALSRLHDLQQGGEDTSPTIWEGEDSSYPKLHVRQASDCSASDTTTVADQRSFNAGFTETETPLSPDRHSRLSYDEAYSISDFEENQPPSSPFERMFIETPSDASSPMHIHGPKVVGHDRHQVTEGFGEQTPNLSEVDPYAVCEEIGEQCPGSYEIDGHQMSEEIGEQTPDTFETGLQQVSDGNGAESPYFVEFDPYHVHVSDGIEEQTPDSSQIYQHQHSEELPAKTPKYGEIDPNSTPEAIWEQTDDHSEVYCKEVQCIESKMTDNVQKANTLPLEEGESFPLMSHENNRCTDDEPKRETEPSDMGPSSIQDPKEASDKQQMYDVPDNLDCSVSSQSNVMQNASPSFLEKGNSEMKNECGCGDDKFIVRLENLQRKLSALRYGPDNKDPEISEGDVELDETPVAEIKVADNIKNTENFACVTEIKEIIKPPSMEQLPDCQLEATMHKLNTPIKDMKDVGLNPQDDLDTGSPWLSDVNRLQKEILDLWDTCNVSLVHRTYFFLLFIKSDQADPIYMEVERRRLSIIKDAFNWGNAIVLDGRELTPGSSKKSLHSEREMLGRLMKKRLSSQERKDLYVKWGISLDTKRRKSRLAQRLWINTIDMDHIVESANIVAKLVRFSEPQVPKEVFGLNLMTNQGRRKSYKWKQNANLLM